jgi:hypothetical protein
MYYLHLFRLESPSCNGQATYYYLVDKNSKMSKSIRQIKKYIRFCDKKWDIAYGYEYVGHFPMFDGLDVILFGDEKTDVLNYDNLPVPT